VAPDARVGTLVDGRYRVLEVLGSGGMGVVYLAEHVHIQRKVALKLLHSVLTQFPEVGARFEREAVAIGRIDHPNCVGISDFGRLDDGSMYLVMDLVDGESLGEILDREERLPWRRALAIGRHVLRGIGHAHEVGVVHRDIKPDNIIVAPRGGDLDAATIVDFGIAKLVDGGGPAQPGYRPITQQGTAFGTPTYMSPEQAAGGAIDGRADLYSLSVVMYELIAGRPPFLGDTGLDVVAMHLRAEPPRFAELDAPVAVPAAVERVLRRGLAKAPADRFAAASEYLAAIDRCL
jgi:serine/threonine protein kinase